MIATPPASPNTIPVEEPTVAIAVLLLLHVPPGVASANVIDCPWQTPDEPVIEEGSGLTETGNVV